MNGRVTSSRERSRHTGCLQTLTYSETSYCPTLLHLKSGVHEQIISQCSSSRNSIVWCACVRVCVRACVCVMSELFLTLTSLPKTEENLQTEVVIVLSATMTYIDAYGIYIHVLSLSTCLFSYTQRQFEVVDNWLHPPLSEVCSRWNSKKSQLWTVDLIDS